MFAAHEADLGSDDWDRVAGLYRSAFPGEEEWVSLDDLRRIAGMPEGRLTSLELDGTWCGFMHWVETGRVAYVAYLAVDPSTRSRGVGSRALAWLRERVGGKPIVLDAELLDEDAPDAEIRERRQAFYLRNGFVRTGWQCGGSRPRYDVLCTSTGFDPAWEREAVGHTFGPPEGPRMWRTSPGSSHGAPSRPS